MLSRALSIKTKEQYDQRILWVFSFICSNHYWQKLAIIKIGGRYEENPE
jgi:hypothetical protein